MKKYNALAKDIVAHVGGKENVSSLRHCVTRLRFNLIDESKADDEYLKNLDGVITIMKAMGEYMVVIGEHVPKVYEEVCLELGMNVNKANNSSTENKKKKKPVEVVMHVIMGALMPLMNVMCACGIIKGLLTLLTLTGIMQSTDGLYQIFAAIGDSIFYFLPLLLGYNLAKKLEMKQPFIGLLIGATLCYPAINGVDIDLFGYVVNATYTGTFLPVIFTVCLAKPLERFFDRYIPELVRGFFVPVLVMMMVVPLGFALVGPLANQIGIMVNQFIDAVVGINTILGGIVVGGLYQILVLFGVHGLLLTLPFMELVAGNPSQLMGFLTTVSFAQTAVVLAVYLKTKDKKLKSIALPAFISGIFGVTEPAIYGVTLPRIKMFIISCIGGAIGGGLIAALNMTLYTYSGIGITGLLGLMDPNNPQVLPIIIVIGTLSIFSFVVAYIMYKDDDVKIQENSTEKLISKQESIYSPIKGDISPLSSSSDEAFASGAIGKGILIEPKEGKVYAPFDGVVRTLFPTKHAIGIVSDNGCEVLVHIGMDTVKLDGEGFEAYVQQGDEVKKGQLLISFNLNEIKKKGYNLSTPVIVTNSDNYIDIVEIDNSVASEKDVLLTAIC